VPWIEDGELTVYDSTVINEYLNEKSDHAPLLPQDVALRAKARALENYADEGVLSKFLPMIWMPWWAPEEQRDRDAMQKGRDGLVREIFPFLEGALGEQDYLCGEFSLADVPMMSVAMVLEVDGMDSSSFTTVSDYFARLRSRPSYQAITPSNSCADTAHLLNKN
jgi:glutathione S-transferase